MLKRAALMDALDALHSATWMDYVNSIFAQTTAGINVSRISPYSVFRFTGEIISDNGFHGFMRFFGKARVYHDNYHEFMLDKNRADQESYHLVVNEAWSFNSFMSSKPVNYNEIPVFEYNPPGM